MAMKVLQGLLRGFACHIEGVAVAPESMRPDVFTRSSVFSCMICILCQPGGSVSWRVRVDDVA